MARKPRISADIVSLMARGKRHAWTLEDLHGSLARTGAPIDFSSVFRAAEKLTADRVIEKVVLESGRARFELAGTHHDHLYCSNCQRLVPLPCVLRPRDLAELESHTGVGITGHRILFRGVCRKCRSAAQRRGKSA
ncbi:MAG TPA: transcriptional repressor [Burkholderiales bacterium]|nr:transcriptional repressor [Burkholderiales bacterium]